MVSRVSKSGSVRLAIAISLGVALLALAIWFSFSETLRSLEHRSRLTYLAIGLFAASAATIRLRRMKLTPLEKEPALFLYRLSEGLGLIVLAVLLFSWGLGGFLSLEWQWVGIFSAGAFILAAYFLIIYRTLPRARNRSHVERT